MAKVIPPQALAKTTTILIVEDDPINARVFSKILSKRGGFNVCHTEIVEDVLRIAASGAVDLIQMDVSLSHSFYLGKAVDGIKITQMLKADSQTSNIPVILVTAHAMEGDRENFLKQSGADDYISKPVVAHTAFVEQMMRSLPREAESLKIDLNRLIGFKNLVLIFAYEKNQLRHEKLSLLRQINRLKEEHQETVAALTGKNNFKQNQPSQQPIEKYKAICSAVAHSLKGEFMHIGYSVKDIQELASKVPEIQEKCDLITRSLEYSQILLRQLLDHLDMGKPSIEPIDVIELIRKTELLARPRLPSNIDLEVIVDSSLQEQKVLGNFEQLMSVILEFIKNATKALRQQGGKIELCVTKKDSDLAISVKDNGPGISEEVKDKLFKETVSSKSGLGLGLFVSNKVIHELGGKLDLETSPNEGTKVTILLPIAND